VPVSSPASCARNMVRRDLEHWTRLAFGSSSRICGTHWRGDAVNPSFSESHLDTVIFGRYVARKSCRTEEKDEFFKGSENRFIRIVDVR
jgi:hypothetical protein